MTLTIGKKNDDRLKLEFNLDKQQVESASLTVNNDAGIILKTLVLKIFQKHIKNKGAFTRENVKRNFRILMSLDEEDFQTKEDFDEYEDYMRILIDKVRQMPVVETIKDLEGHLKGKKSTTEKVKDEEGQTIEVEVEGSVLFEMFGAEKENSILSNLREKNVTIEQLQLPAYLGQTYEGVGSKPSKLMNALDKDKSIFDEDKIDSFMLEPETTDTSVTYTWDLKAYQMKLLEEDGFLEQGKSIEDVGAHIRLIPMKEKEQDKLNVQVGNRILFNSREFVIDTEITMGKEGKEELKGFTIYKDGQKEKTFALSPSDRNAAIKYIKEEITLKRNDEVLDRLTKYILENSSFMRARRTKDRDAATRANEPSLSELTRTYLDLDTGKMSLEIAIKPTTLRLLEEQEKTKRDKIDILDYTIIFDKEAELRLAEEGAFIVADRDKLKSISEIVKGIKTFMAKSRRFRS